MSEEFFDYPPFPPFPPDLAGAKALEKEIVVKKEGEISKIKLDDKEVIIALKTVYDPEVPVNIYDLGLIYKIEISDQGAVNIIMTLTSPLCPIADQMPQMVADAVLALEGVSEVKVKIVWEPSWDLSMITDEGRFLLNLM